MGPLDPLTLAYLDVETTGLSARFGDRICEIAVIRCSGEDILESFAALVNPGRPISPGAARVNGLSDSDLADAPRFAQVAGRVMALIQGAVIVGHNLPFDLGFVSSELERAGRPLPILPALDTLGIARKYF